MRTPDPKNRLQSETATIKEMLREIIAASNASASHAAKNAKQPDWGEADVMMFYLTLKAQQMASCMTVFKEQLIRVISNIELYDPVAAQKMRGEFVEVSTYSNRV
jgi:hypothetical protein